MLYPLSYGANCPRLTDWGRTLHVAHPTLSRLLHPLATVNGGGLPAMPVLASVWNRGPVPGRWQTDLAHKPLFPTAFTVNRAPPPGPGAPSRRWRASCAWRSGSAPCLPG